MACRKYSAGSLFCEMASFYWWFLFWWHDSCAVSEAKATGGLVYLRMGALAALGAGQLRFLVGEVIQDAIQLTVRGRCDIVSV